MEISPNRYQKRPEQHLHSPAHVLADELCSKLNDKKHFGFYLKMANTYDHGMLRRIAGEVLEGKATKKPGALFAFLIKKYNQEQDAKNSQSPQSDPDPESRSH